VKSAQVVQAIAAIALLGAVWPLMARVDTQAPIDYTKISPVDLVNRVPKGGLHNPYKDTETNIVSQGEALFRSYPCSGCHGGTGGGGMAPPLTKGSWVYGGDDDSLFRLVALGSVDLQKKGYTRKGIAAMVGPMPPLNMKSPLRNS
jgi:mono/diheme cytochrome c family protein